MLGKNAKLFFGVSMCVLIAAIVLATWGFPKIVQSQINKNLRLENSSAMFEKWRVMPVPLTFKVYVFNVSNAEDVNEGAKPILNEIGPYVYKEYREKRILGYGENDTIRYMLKKTFYFDKEASGNLTQDDDVTVINYAYLAALLTVHDLMPSAVGLVNSALGNFFTNLTDPFLRVKARDLFFDGIFLNCAGEQSALSLVCGKIKSDKPPNMRLAEDGSGFYFSMFNYLNTTESGPYNMVRGIEDIQELGHIVAYNDMTTMRQWGDPYCGQLNGSDGSIFPPMNLGAPERIYIFEPEICRSLYISLVGERNIFNISTYLYEMDESALASKLANPNNKCFCKKNWSANHDGCLLMGLLNMSPCKGAPALASLPHFYLGSEELLEYFDGGVSPNKEKHESYAYLDATTGVVLKGAQRLQFNIELRNMQVPQLENVLTGVFPMLWIEEGAEIPADLREELHQAHTLLGYVEAVRWALLGLAILLCVASAACVSRAGLSPCPRHHNSVSFILRPGNNFDVNKGQ
ncbi:sensory neuron membrane protein 2-like [Maniola hyperantus]|uniref:sensory neuron membrane protein 2-like n=1 Tax=Aphantopus hyperantus TaxID=2795564 RepID=UPI0015694CC7|nr:sensory neuron membrane protein 2-like [Maniola hyperantus]XP_034825643.1 sensory neuron membrane protein 2-like [Maniola hyperantus]